MYGTLPYPPPPRGFAPAPRRGNPAADSALLSAVESNSADGVTRAIKDGASPNARSTDGNATALCTAVSRGVNDVVVALLRAGAAVDIPNSEGDFPVHIAAKAGRTDILRELLRARRDGVVARNANGDQPLHVAAQWADSDAVDLLLSHGAMPNEPGFHMQTPLHVAALRGHDEIAYRLLSAGANPIARDDTGKTPLHQAAFYEGNPDVARRLLRARVNPDAQDELGATPLHWAAGAGTDKTVKLLIDDGARLNIPTYKGNTPLHLAAKEGQTESARLLTQAGARTDARNASGERPADLARRGNHNATADVIERGQPAPVSTNTAAPSKGPATAGQKANLVMKAESRIVISPFRQVLVPEAPLSEFFIELVDPFGAKTALIDADTGHKVTYAQLQSGIRQVAASLFERGLRKGDVFAIMCPNIPEYAVIFHAVCLIGGVITPVDPDWTVDQVAFQLNDTRARFMIATPDLLNKADAAIRRSDVRELYVFGEDSTYNAIPFRNLFNRGTAFPDTPINVHTDLAVICYTSGRHSPPVGVEYTHYNLVAALSQFLAYEDLSTEDVVLGVVPFHHIFGLAYELNLTLARGATLISLYNFDFDDMTSAISTHRVTRAYVVPPILSALANTTANLSSLKRITSGGAPLDPSVAQSVERKFGCIVRQMYGSSATILTHSDLCGDSTKVPHESIGQLVPNAECRVIDPYTGMPAGIGQKGELFVRGPHFFSGYHNDPIRTAESVDPQGWLRTGDIGYFDDRGLFYIVNQPKVF